MRTNQSLDGFMQLICAHLLGGGAWTEGSLACLQVTDRTWVVRVWDPSRLKKLASALWVGSLPLPVPGRNLFADRQTASQDGASDVSASHAEALSGPKPPPRPYLSSNHISWPFKMGEPQSVAECAFCQDVSSPLASIRVYAHV